MASRELTLNFGVGIVVRDVEEVGQHLLEGDVGGGAGIRVPKPERERGKLDKRWTGERTPRSGGGGGGGGRIHGEALEGSPRTGIERLRGGKRKGEWKRAGSGAVP